MSVFAAVLLFSAQGLKKRRSALLPCSQLMGPRLYEGRLLILRLSRTNNLFGVCCTRARMAD